MITLTAMTTASGRLIDLLSPTPADIAFCDITEQLAKINRYNGATPGRSYNVAEHSVRAADAALAASGDETVAAYVLCHDMHEAYLGDDITPKKRALAALAEREFGVLACEIMRAFAALTERWDTAIHTAAGLPWPPPARVTGIVKVFDRMQLDTEWRDLMPGPPPFPPEPGIKPLPDPIHPCSWRVARLMLQQRCLSLLPALKGSDCFTRTWPLPRASEIAPEAKDASLPDDGKVVRLGGRS